MNVESKYLGTRTHLVSPAGDLDFHTVDALRDELEHIVSEGARTVIADLTEVAFIDSTGLAALLRGSARLQSHGGELVLVASNRLLLNLFEVTGFDRQFSILGTVAEALARAPAAHTHAGV